MSNQTQKKFEVTKELLEGWVSQGHTVNQIAEELTSLAGKKCSPGNVRSLCKHFEINLRKKPTSFFIPAKEVAKSEQTVEVKEEATETTVDPVSFITNTNA